MPYESFIQRGTAEWRRLTPAVEARSSTTRHWLRAGWVDGWRSYWAPLGMLRWLAFRSWRV